MPQQSPEEMQSFLLSFWYEGSRLGPGQWRGTVWHRQLGDAEHRQAVAGPEEAFDLVRRSLQRARPSEDARPIAGLLRRLFRRIG